MSTGGTLRSPCKISSKVIPRNTTSHNPCNDDRQDDSEPTHNKNNASGHTGIPLNDPSPRNITLDNTIIPSHISPSKDILPRNILAFRTITTLLALIQQERPFKVSDESVMEMDQLERQELKISSAFSNLAVTDNDIVAVVTKSSPETLAVIVCTRLSNHESSFISPQSIPKNPLSRIWHFLVTKNFRRDDSKSTWVTDPTIFDPEIPDGFKTDDDETLKSVYLDKRW
jgi:hypothetical protein